MSRCFRRARGRWQYRVDCFGAGRDGSAWFFDRRSSALLALWLFRVSGRRCVLRLEWWA